MSVSEIKTMYIFVGSKGNSTIHRIFYNTEIEQVIQYKCLGVTVRLMRKNNENMLANDYPYLSDQGGKPCLEFYINCDPLLQSLQR